MSTPLFTAFDNDVRTQLGRILKAHYENFVTQGAYALTSGVVYTVDVGDYKMTIYFDEAETAVVNAYMSQLSTGEIRGQFKAGAHGVDQIRLLINSIQTSEWAAVYAALKAYADANVAITAYPEPNYQAVK